MPPSLSHSLSLPLSLLPSLSLVSLPILPYLSLLSDSMSSGHVRLRSNSMNAPSDSLSGTSIDDTDTLVDSSVHHHQPDYTLPHPYPAHLTASQKKILSQVKPSRWSTPEFYFYGIAFLFVVPYMFKVAIDLSSGMSFPFFLPFWRYPYDLSFSLSLSPSPFR